MKINSLIEKFPSFLENRSLLKILFGLSYLVFILLIEVITYQFEKSEVKELATFMKGYLWEMDDVNAKEFEKILTETKGYRSIKIYHPDNSVFAEDEINHSLGFFRKTLKFFLLIRPITLTSNIYKDKINIGRIEVVWLNENIYIHLGVLVIIALLYVIILSYLKILQNRKELNKKNHEINEKMHEVEKLKIQQDGDYYLTSLLIRPLGKLNAVSNYFNIEKFIKQKKKFEFKKKDLDIGGDICITEKITLRGNDYIVFVNADAMGKSLQGAGGALVFGSALNAIITRNKSSVSNQNYYPEVWLKNTFVDLHKVFETFDGTMLMSAVIGLIDENNGFMYWINAEHPSIVLYRDGRAELLEINDVFMKLGVQGASKTLSIKHIQLYPGDMIFSGSDGRDDLFLGKDDSGNNIMNSDETIFLRNVEVSKGDLEQLYLEIEKTGALTDDLSILKIEYKASSEQINSKNAHLEGMIIQAKRDFTRGDRAGAERLLYEILGSYPASADAIRLLLRIYFERKDYVGITEYVDRYLNLKPSDTEFIYLASYAHKKVGNYKMGIAYGERYRLRNPNSTRNLLNLYDLYHKDRNFEKSVPLIDKILILDPNNEKALAIRGGDYNEEFVI
ncbi:MAG: SpoIIE family protein phosphatase [Leptospiraceae bacterium]|nr:SpoIIE family protein phosphatase [Leptospiraceae bacterium]